ncbi:MAG: AAA family ATPase [Synergistaceae bacterium]|nr:AAA family ATPase [Synergistaceae bacterium]
MDNMFAKIIPNFRKPEITATYEDIGGLKKEVARVREMVELPLLHPEIFEHLGTKPPRGLLLYGSPGCGKTLIARAVAQKSGVHFISVNSAEIIQQHYGESEQRLREIFDEAQQYPASVIFFDEIDALAPNRENVLGDLEKRVVSELLALMDGLKSRGGTIVMAATNLPNQIDPALRRPGRLDREIEIRPPDSQGRLEILRIHTRNMPLNDDVDLERIAAKTPGFLGADLAALCREASMTCLRELETQRDLFVNAPGKEELSLVKVSMRHFMRALDDVELSTTRDVVSEVPVVHWSDIGGLDSAKRLLRDAVELPLKHAVMFEKAKITPSRGILLTGKPGTGKTLLASALGTESEVNFISVRGPELISKWVGDSEKGIREIFKKARQSAPSILFFDEVDALVPERKNDSGASRVSERTTGQFLSEMDGLKGKNVLVLAATNRPDLLDRALLRPGRFDITLELPLPDVDARKSIFEIHTRQWTLGDDVSIDDFAERSEGFSGAEIEALCHMAGMNAMREAIDSNAENFIITRKHFDSAWENLTTPSTP